MAEGGGGGAAFEIGDEQCPCFADAVTPVGDVVAVQPAAGLLGGIAGFYQFALAAHGLFAVRIGVVEVGKIGCHTDKGCDKHYGTCFEEFGECLVSPCIFKVCSYDEQDDKQEVVGHLHMVRHDLQGDEEGCQDAAGQQLAPVGKYNARYCGWDVGKGDELPDVSCGNQDEEVGRKSPHDAAQSRQPHRYAEYPQEDVETQHEDKRQVDVAGKKELVYFLRPLQRCGRVVGWRDLISRHSAEEGIGPAGAFACLFVIFFGLLSGSGSGGSIMLEQDASFYIRWEEVSERNQDECQDSNQIGKGLFYHLES